jgi:hypothetical protein
MQKGTSATIEIGTLRRDSATGGASPASERLRNECTLREADMVRKKTVLAVVISTSLLTSACGWFGSATQGTLTGRVTVSGGPGTPTGGTAFRGLPEQNLTVSLRSNGQQVAFTTTDSQGHYSISLNAGTYSLHACGEVAPGGGDSVTVNAGTTAQHDVSCIAL